MAAETNRDDDGERLRRRLRALSAVNEQLRAQLEATQDELRTTPRRDEAQHPLSERPRPVPVGRAARRSVTASGWLDAVPEVAPDEPAELVIAPDGRLHVLEGGRRRPVRSGLLAAVMEALLGERRPASADELAGMPEAAPIEVLEASAGPPFVVLGQRRLPLDGLPLPYPVLLEEAGRLAPGPSLDLIEAITPRRAHESDGWIAELAREPGATARLTLDGGTLVVVDGTQRRSVVTGLLAPALEQALGPPQPMDAAELAALEEGPPVALLESAHGEPFVVLAGQRCPVRGLPVTFAVHPASAARLPPGPALDVTATQRAARTRLVDQRKEAEARQAKAERKVARVQAELDKLRRQVARDKANPDPARELRAYLERNGGALPVAATAAQKRLRRVTRAVRRRVRR